MTDQRQHPPEADQASHHCDTPPKRRASDHPDFADSAHIEHRFRIGSERMDRLEAQGQATADGVAEVLEIVRMGKNFFKVLGLIGSGIKWVVTIGGPIVGLYYAMKNGGMKQ